MIPLPRPRRALLFVPGDQRARLEKAAGLARAGVPSADGTPLPLDAVIADLEDGVALSQKSAARQTIVTALRELDCGAAERIIRINPVGTPYWLDDLAGTIDARPDAVLIAKVEAADQVTAVADWLTESERERGWPVGAIGLLALLETARGIVFAREIAAASPRLTALCFGAEDLAGSTGAIRQPDLSEAAYARSAVVLHAKAFGLQAIDTPFIRLGAAALPDLAAEARAALVLGYDGKLAIHPEQIPVITTAFAPSPDEVAAARRLLDAYEAQQAAGIGAFAFEGRMIDLPAVRHARAVLSRAL
jgi:citrate lyase beta subunit